MSRLLDLHNFVGEKLQWQQQVLHDRELSATAKVIACQLMHDLNVSKRGAWRSQIEISGLLGIHLRTVRRSMAELVGAGHLTTTPSRGRGNAILYEALLKLERESARIEGEMPPIQGAKAGQRKAGISCTPTAKKGAGHTEKGALPAPPYLDQTITSPLTPREPRSQVDAASEVGLAGELTAVPSEIRSALIEDPRFGEAWVASWIDPCRFNPETREIHARTSFARGRVREAIGQQLKGWGCSLGEPRAGRS